MRKARFATRTLSAAAAAALLLAPLPATSINGDDVFLLTTAVAPNVIVLFDNSESMSQIEWHPAFDQSVVPAGCAHYADATQYDAATFASQETHCGNTRKLWNPADAKNPVAYWSGRYLNWYFSDAADAYANEIETAVIANIGCNKTAQFPNKYRRTRGQAARETILQVLCVAEALDVRFGLASFRDPEDASGVDSNGGYVAVELDRSNPSHAAELESHLKNTVMGSAGPLAEALFQIYTYYMSRVLLDMPKGADGLTSFPRYQYAKDGDWETLTTKWTVDPMEYPCQKSYVVIVTDGSPERDDFDVELTLNEATGFASFMSLIGDYHDEGADGVADPELPGDANETSWFLDDIAMYMQQNDFRTNETLFPGDQVIDTYTVGLATDATTNAFLQMTADVGNGLFFEARDGEALALALLAALNDIIEKSRSFTAATVPSARTADGGAFFNSFFLPSGSSAFWQGHLRAWTIDAAGDILDANGDCALFDPDAGECNSGAFKPICVSTPGPECAVPFWDAGEEIPNEGSRNLVVSKLVSSTPTLVDFDQSLSAADMTVATFSAPPAPAPNSALYPVYGSTALNAEGLADEVVAFARGCHFGTGVTSADVGTPVACVERAWLLGDIFHSNPIVVGRPHQVILEPSYIGPTGFMKKYESRPRVIFAGTNAGWLEAFHAGDYDTSTGRYDAGTGTELFGFMPSHVRKRIKNQPVDFPTSRTHYVDGALQAADWWQHPTPTTASSAKALNGSEWRTALVGGLRGGGTQYYALDVTDPDDVDAGLPYPGLMWEFPDENDAGGDAAFMGETWGTPIITKVRLAVGGDDNGGFGYERWVAVVTAGYHPGSDPNPKEVSGLGSPTYVASTTNGRAIYILDLKTGEVLAEKTYNHVIVDPYTGASNCPAAADSDPEANMCFAMVASPTVLDLNFDGFADVIYVVDLGGQVFKWVVRPVGEDRVNDGSGLRTQPNWPFVRFFKAPVAIGKYYKNLFFPPAATLIGGQLWLAFASGERLHLPYLGDPARDENNRFYVMTDLDPLEQVGLGELRESDLTNVSATQGASTFSTRGYFFKGADGEKWVTNIEIFAGDVIGASFTPSSSTDLCTSRGEGKLYAFNVRTGEGQFKDNANNPLRGIAIGSGLPTDPKVSIGVGGQDTRIIIEKSGADFESEEGKDVDVGGRLLYWRER